MRFSSATLALVLAVSQVVAGETIVVPNVYATNYTFVPPITPEFQLSIVDAPDPDAYVVGSTTLFTVEASATDGFATIAYVDTDLGKERVWFGAEFDQRFTPSTRKNASHLGANFYLEGVASYTERGSVEVPVGNDFWLAVNTSTELHGPLDYYGWVQLNIDDNLQVTAIDSAFSLNGTGITVGRFAVPEPASGFMAFMSAVILGLLRRKQGRKI